MSDAFEFGSDKMYDNVRWLWLENKYEHKLISAQCILTGKHGCRRFGSMAKRIVNCIYNCKKTIVVVKTIVIVIIIAEVNLNSTLKCKCHEK